MDQNFIDAIDSSLKPLGYSDRSKFIRDAVLEKLQEMGIEVDPSLALAPQSKGRGGRPKEYQISRTATEAWTMNERGPDYVIGAKPTPPPIISRPPGGVSSSAVIEAAHAGAASAAAMLSSHSSVSSPSSGDGAQTARESAPVPGIGKRRGKRPAPPAPAPK